MKSAKTIIGIISIVLCVFIMIQSCAAGLGNAIEDNGESSGSAGLIVAVLMLIAGISGIATRKSKGGGIVVGVFYAIAGLVGISSYGSFSDLKIWAILCFIFAVVFILGSLKMTGRKDKQEAAKSEEVE